MLNLYNASCNTYITFHYENWFPFIASTKQQMVTIPCIPEMQQSQQNCSLPVLLLCNATCTKQKSSKPVSCRNLTMSKISIVKPEILQFIFITWLQKLCPNFLIVNFTYYIVLDVSDSLKLWGIIADP